MRLKDLVPVESDHVQYANYITEKLQAICSEICPALDEQVDDGTDHDWMDYNGGGIPTILDVVKSTCYREIENAIEHIQTSWPVKRTK